MNKIEIVAQIEILEWVETLDLDPDGAFENYFISPSTISAKRRELKNRLAELNKQKEVE